MGAAYMDPIQIIARFISAPAVERLSGDRRLTIGAAIFCPMIARPFAIFLLSRIWVQVIQAII